MHCVNIKHFRRDSLTSALRRLLIGSNTGGKSKRNTFLASFLGGFFGADWFYLSFGNAVYIVAGLFKLFTLGGLGIWWLTDWIRVLVDIFPDANGNPLIIDM